MGNLPGLQALLLPPTTQIELGLWNRYLQNIISLPNPQGEVANLLGGPLLRTLITVFSWDNWIKA